MIGDLQALRDAAEAIAAIEQDGYTVLTSVIPQDALDPVVADIAQLVAAAPYGDREFVGFKTKRLYALLGKTRVLENFILEPRLLGVTRHFLGAAPQCGQDIAVCIDPGEVAQGLHYDAGIYPLPRNFDEVFLTTIWAIGPFTTENGATRVVPGSHHPDTDRPGDDTPTVPVEMEPGDVLVMSGKLYHGAGANISDTPRLAVILDFVASWLRPAENHYLSVPIDTACRMPPPLQDYLGYSQPWPHYGYVDGEKPAEFLARAAHPRHD
jgi:ectoine hydroxylase-related dioxygenase (phytanoyl-CoA dioxygenase family)